MKKNSIQDERIISVKRKIQSDGFQILLLVLIASTLFQQIILRAPFSQYAVEFFCWFSCGPYILIRNLMQGIDLQNSQTKNKKTLLKTVFVSGILTTLLLIFVYGENNTNTLLIFFSCFIFFNLLFQILITFINKKRLQHMDVLLSKDEMDD